MVSCPLTSNYHIKKPTNMSLASWANFLFSRPDLLRKGGGLHEVPIRESIPLYKHRSLSSSFWQRTSQLGWELKITHTEIGMCNWMGILSTFKSYYFHRKLKGRPRSSKKQEKKTRQRTILSTPLAWTSPVIRRFPCVLAPPSFSMDLERPMTGVLAL